MARFHEPAWHRRARRNRLVARRVLSAVPQTQRVSKKRALKLVQLLDSHHGSAVPVKVKKVFATKTITMSQVWWCRFCEVRMGLATTHCTHCSRHWKQANYDAAKERSASKSRESKRSKSQRKKQPMTPKGQTSVEEGKELQLFTEKPPWISTTPKTRVDVSQTNDESGEMAAAEERVLTEQQERYKQQLLELKRIRGVLPEEMERELQELQPAVQMPVLTHKHLNQLSKLGKMVSAIHKKILEMDSQWQDFVSQANEKFNKHRALYMQTREQLFVDLREKTTELNKLKAEIATASEGLQPTPVEESFDQVSSEVLASLMGQQQFKLEQLESPTSFLDGEVWDVDEEMVAAGEMTTEIEKEAQRKRAVAPFSRGVTSPTKVHQHNLKAKTHEQRRKEPEKNKDKTDSQEVNA